MAHSRHVSLFAAFVIVGLSIGSGSTDATSVPGPQPILSKARARVSAAVGHDFFVHVWTAPSKTGGVCNFNTVDHQSVAQQPASWPTSGGGSCNARTPPGEATRLRAFRYVSISIARKDAEHSVPTNIEGELVTTVAPRRLLARWAGGSLALTLRHHYFAGGSPAMYGQASSLKLIAYDRHGHAIALFKNGP